MNITGNTTPISWFPNEEVQQFMLCRFRQRVDADTGEWSEMIEWIPVRIPEHVMTAKMRRQWKMRPEVRVEGAMINGIMIAEQIDIIGPKRPDTPPRKALPQREEV